MRWSSLQTTNTELNVLALFTILSWYCLKLLHCFIPLKLCDVNTQTNTFLIAESLLIFYFSQRFEHIMNFFSWLFYRLQVLISYFDPLHLCNLLSFGFRCFILISLHVFYTVFSYSYLYYILLYIMSYTKLCTNTNVIRNSKLSLLL